MHAVRLLERTRRVQPRYGQDGPRPCSAARSTLISDVLVQVHPIDVYICGSWVSFQRALAVSTIRMVPSVPTIGCCPRVTSDLPRAGASPAILSRTCTLLCFCQRLDQYF